MVKFFIALLHENGVANLTINSTNDRHNCKWSNIDYAVVSLLFSVNNIHNR